MRLGAAPAAAASPAADSGRHASSPSSPTPARGSRGAGARRRYLARRRSTEYWGLCPSGLEPHVSESDVHLTYMINITLTVEFVLPPRGAW
jgi:hypothetical protein